MTIAPATPRKRKKPSEQAVHITERDLTLLQRLCRYGATTVPTLQHTVAAGKHRSGIYAQAARLARVGLIEDLRTGPSNLCRPRNLPALLVPTREGYAVAGTGLAYARPSLATLLHTLSVAQVGLDFEANGWEVITDRVVRHEIVAWRSERERARKAKQPVPPVPAEAVWIATERDSSAEVGGMLSGARGPRTHAPDLIVRDTDGRLVAVEVELTAKNAGDLREVMRAFAGTSKYTEVIYYTPERAIAEKVAKAAAVAGGRLDARMTARKFTPLYATTP